MSVRICVIGCALALNLVLAAGNARAGLVVYEGFDMGAVAGALAGKAGATSIGFDAAGWAALAGGATPGSYETTGLTFGSGATALLVAGGRARLNSDNFGGTSDLDIMSRGLNVNVTGTVWGSFLGQRVVNSGSEQDAMHFLVGRTSSSTDNTSDMVLSFEEFNSNLGGLRGEGGAGGPAGFPHYNAGDPIADGQTYMVLFKATNLGGTSGATELAEWILTSAQFDNFKQGGLTEAELNAASTGSAATNVLQKGSISYVPLTVAKYPRLTTADFLLLNTFRGLHGRFDELRLSDALTGGAGGGLDQVTTLVADVPEAGAWAFLAAASGMAGLVAGARRRSFGRFLA